MFKTAPPLRRSLLSLALSLLLHGGVLVGVVALAAAAAATLLGVALVSAGVLAEKRFFPIVNVIVVVCGGMGLAGIWAAGRKCLLDLAPPDQIGAYFSLYVLSQKVSVIGSLTFFTLAAKVSYRAAILTQAALLIPGLMLIFAFRYPDRDYAPSDE